MIGREQKVKRIVHGILRISERVRGLTTPHKVMLWLALLFPTALIQWTMLDYSAGHPYVFIWPVSLLAGMVLGQFAGIMLAVVECASTLMLDVSAPDHGNILADFLTALCGVSLTTFTVYLLNFFYQERANLLHTTNAAETERSFAESRLRDLRHRFANELQRLTLTVKMQRDSVSSEEAKRALHDTEQRVLAIASVNNRLSEFTNSQDGIDTEPFLAGLVDDLQATIGLRPIRLAASVQPITLPEKQVMMLGIIINEAVTNSLKYAFPGEDGSGSIEIEFVTGGGMGHLRVADNGVGFDIQAKPRGTGVGQRLMRSLACQMGGTHHISSDDNGTVFRLDFKLPVTPEQQLTPVTRPTRGDRPLYSERLYRVPG